MPKTIPFQSEVETVTQVLADGDLIVFDSALKFAGAFDVTANPVAEINSLSDLDLRATAQAVAEERSRRRYTKRVKVVER